MKENKRTVKILFFIAILVGCFILFGGKKCFAYASSIKLDHIDDTTDPDTYYYTLTLEPDETRKTSYALYEWDTSCIKYTSTLQNRVCGVQHGLYKYSYENKYQKTILLVTHKAYSSHLPGNRTSITEATCTKDGKKVYTCTRCGREVTEKIPKLGHDWKFYNTEADCTHSAYIRKRCTRTGCGVDTLVGPNPNSKPLGHHFVNGVCTRTGCNAKEGSGGTSSDVTVHVHNYSDATCEEPKKCSSCGATSGSALGHNYVNGVCTRCGELETEGVLNEWDLTINGLVSGNTKATLSEDGTLTISGEGLYGIGDYDKPDSDNVQDRCPITGRSRIKKVHITGTAYNIGTYLFYYCTNIEEVVIDNPESITRIGEGAFFGCIRLKSFKMPPNITAIGARVFCHCHNLEKLDFASAKGLQRIGHEVARDCWLLKDVTLPEGLKVIGYEAFLNCMSLKNVIIPSTVVAMGTKAVSLDETGLGNSSQLTDTEKENGNTKGYNNVFTIDFSRNVGQEVEYESYQKLVFARNNISDLSGLLTQTKIYYYPSNTLLGTYANQKDSLELGISPLNWDISNNQDNSITATLDTAGKLTIEGTGATKDYELGETPWNTLRDDIKTVEVKEGITKIGRASFYYNESLTSVSLPTTLKQINYSAFSGCISLPSITIPDNVTVIGACAFAHCESLTSITLPKGITKLYRETFSNCYKLQTVKLLGDVTAIGNMNFFNCPSLKSFTVSPYIEEVGEKAFTVDFTDNEDTRYKDVESLTPCSIEYYSMSDVMRDYIKDNTERTFTAKDLDEFSIKTTPTKTKFYKGDALDTTGLVLTAAYYNGSTKDTKLTKEVIYGYTYTPEVLDTVGTQTITITYAGKTATFNVTVEDLKVDSIAIKTAPNKTTYIAGDTLDTEGLVITATYNNGTVEDYLEGFTCTPTKLNTAGTQTITVTYEGKTATFNVTVNALKVNIITVKTTPNKTNYIVGDTLDTTGLVITATYNNGTVKDITTGFTCTPTKLNTAGTQTITVTYEGKTATFEVTVAKKVITVESEDYSVSNKYITKIQGDTTLEELKNNIGTNATSKKVYDKDGNEISDTEAIATGMKLVLDDEATYILVVTGDVDGDGKANLDDIFSINKYRLHKAQLIDEYLMAGDVNQDDKVDLYDIFQINKYRLGKTDIL